VIDWKIYLPPFPGTRLWALGVIDDLLRKGGLVSLDSGMGG
jgi:hypothetical protein